MAEARLAVLGGYQAVISLRARLKDPGWVERRLMKGIGNILVGEAQRAFREQRLGDIAWKHRYPNQQDPVVNVAGVVADFLMGKREPPDRRFDRRPAGMDTGMLLRSLTPGKAVTARGMAVEVGSSQSNASAVQFGGRSDQPVNETVKERLRAWMKRERKRTDKAGEEGGVFKKRKGAKEPVRTTMAQALRLMAVRKLGFLLSPKRNRLITRANPRPFLGITDAAEAKIMELIVDTLGDESRGAVRIEKK